MLSWLLYLFYIDIFWPIPISDVPCFYFKRECMMLHAVKLYTLSFTLITLIPMLLLQLFALMLPLQSSFISSLRKLPHTFSFLPYKVTSNPFCCIAKPRESHIYFSLSSIACPGMCMFDLDDIWTQFSLLVTCFTTQIKELSETTISVIKRS